MTVPRALIGLLVALGLFLAVQAPSAMAHAELIRSDPPVDGLEVTSPEAITLTFSEEVERTDPAPIISVLDQQGNAVSDTPLAIQESDDARTLVVPVPELDRGTWTVAWTVTSATDGHTLSGTFAFRVGGGLPPGLASTPDEIPAPWAVATRWLTFLGASVALGLLLFGDLLVIGDEPGTRWRRWRSRSIVAGAAVALLATVAEPLLLWAFDRPTDSTSLADMVRSLPTGWWWRPAMLIPLVILSLYVLIPARGSIARPMAWCGTALGLGSLLGMVMTSHAAGRATWRTAAIASDMAHQWSVALWTGGLVALVVWFAAKAGEDESSSLRLKRFSSAAIVLFAVAVITGLVNTGFVFPFVNQIRDDGWSLDVFEPLWTSNYGIILIAKVLLLAIPLTLAIYHRSLVTRVLGGTLKRLDEIPRRFRHTLRWELAAVAVVIGGGVALALSAPPAPETNAIDRITLVASTSVDPSSDSMLVHLTIDPAQAGDNELTARLTDWDGAAIDADPTPRVVLSFTSLDHDTDSGGIGMEPVSGTPGTYQTSGLNLSLEGWWQIDATIQQAGQQNQFATFYTLLPDPNTQGFDAPPKPDSDPAAEALFNTAYSQMLAWQRVRWTEDLGSGNDALVRARFAVVDGEGDAPDATSLDVTYSAGFQPLANGDPPRPAAYDSRSSITIGDQSWLRTTNGDWLEEPAGPITMPSGWGSIYAGATNHQMGITQTIDGQELQVVTFYLPEQTGQAEAWLAWWINTATGDVVRVTMTARMHYMVWTYTDINGDFTIGPPIAG